MALSVSVQNSVSFPSKLIAGGMIHEDNIQFDMEAAIKALREGKGLTGQDGILTPLIKQLTEAAMKAELDEHLASGEAPWMSWRLNEAKLTQ